MSAAAPASGASPAWAPLTLPPVAQIDATRATETTMAVDREGIRTAIRLVAAGPRAQYLAKTCVTYTRPPST